MFAGTNKVWISADRTTRLEYDTANGTLNLYVNNNLIGVFDDSSGTLGATMSEINNVADVSARVEEHTGAGAVTAGVQSVEINSVAAAALTIADAANHQGFFIVKHTSSSDAQSHTLTLTSGTYDGTNNVALLNAANEALVVYFDSGGAGTIVENVGSVSLG